MAKTINGFTMTNPQYQELKTLVIDKGRLFGVIFLREISDTKIPNSKFLLTLRECVRIIEKIL